MNTNVYFVLHLVFALADGFVPHPAIRLGGQAGDSITHTDMTQLGFIQSLMRFFLDKEVDSKDVDRRQKLQDQHTIDELYQLVYPSWSSSRVKLYSYPLKRIIDLMQVKNALVDLSSATKKLPSAHFDSESFLKSNRRIIGLRNQVIADAMDPTKDLAKARGRIGELLHTLQDFYSHSNWVEMGQTKINHRIGIEENIGPLAQRNQSTCTSDGCRKMKSSCSLIQGFILKTCPMQYYDCTNNIRDEINQQGLLTSGYVSDQETTVKPTDVEKCSHGSVMDSTAHQTPVGGINKDTMTPVYSPHYHLHFQAVKLAVEATERFFDDLRQAIGDRNFARLFAIYPDEKQIQEASKSIAERQQFHFLTSSLSIGLTTGDRQFEKTIKQRLQALLAGLFSSQDSETPTFDLSDQGVDSTDGNIHAGTLLADRPKKFARRRLHRH